MHQLIHLIRAHHATVSQAQDFALPLFAEPVFGHTDALFVDPILHALALALAPVGSMVSLGITALELFIRQQVADKRKAPVTGVELSAGHVPMHRERISNPLNSRLLVKALRVAVVRGDAEKSKPTTGRVVDGSVIGQGRVAAALNGPDKPANHLRRVIIRAAIHRMHAD